MSQTILTEFSCFFNFARLKNMISSFTFDGMILLDQLGRVSFQLGFCSYYHPFQRKATSLQRYKDQIHTQATRKPGRVCL